MVFKAEDCVGNEIALQDLAGLRVLERHGVSQSGVGAAKDGDMQFVE